MKTTNKRCEVTECGSIGGLRVRAITDDAGAQVVVDDKQNPGGTHLLSKPLVNHTAAVDLGRSVAEHGIDTYNDWCSPVGLFEFACLCAEARQKKIGS